MIEVAPQLILVSGPARSGKSEVAEGIATATGKAVIYIATAQGDPTDLEWQARIIQHQQRRPDSWQTIETPLDLSTILHTAAPQNCLLIDSLGTWVANYLEQEETLWQETLNNLRESLTLTRADIILVSEEVGWGVIPPYPLGRKFRDRLGNVTRIVGAIANPVYLVTNGYVVNLSQLGIPISQFLAQPSSPQA
ncbi:MAG: bifunctional adenosylcobinamide kinase/adenosylcobinamide-phosphate guanylyltransferase [Coleofasciculaceae cyanobacterium SM2_1_6]|nr:bifunctional adenosylcobinamide kinase/adenosylcobinamide-phosphate guanylyltransferase [Coleofasciculaceae cyanobacterium SM2_1_6]